MSLTHFPYVRCFWTGLMHLTNGVVMPIQCRRISERRVEVEAEGGLQGSKLVKIELRAIHDGNTHHIKMLCDPKLDLFNDHNKHSIKLGFHTIAAKDASFIKGFVEAYS